jgi:hypothetical protein
MTAAARTAPAAAPTFAARGSLTALLPGARSG